MNIKLNKESRPISQSKSSKIVKNTNHDNSLNNNEFKKNRSALNIENDKYIKTSYSNLINTKIHKDKSDEYLILINNKSKFTDYYNKPWLL